MPTHPDLADEQAHLARAWARLAELREGASSAMSPAFQHAGVGTHQALYERDVFVAAAQKRIEHFVLGEEALIFGRIDTTDGTFAHIGRLGITDDAQEPLVVDWRTPIAEPFYRATGAHPMGLRRRRHFLIEAGGIVELEDELFSDGEGEGEGLGLRGSAALLAALKRSRSGRMRDIVATVQREQDEIIRAPLNQILVVEGGPGTGKTAVALHRAAYLLYTHHFPLDLQGVLVIGPNRQYLRYIAHVLPSLGESGAELATVAQLVGHDTNAEELHPVAVLKGDERMATVVRRAVELRQRPRPRETRIGYGAQVLTLTRHDSEEIVRLAKRRPGTHNARRSFVERQVLKRLFASYSGRRSRLAEVRSTARSGAGSESATFEDFSETLAADPAVRTLLGRMWPTLTPEQFLHDLYSVAPLLEAATRGVLSPDEAALLSRPRAAHEDDITWTQSDAALLDEAAALLGPTRAKRGHDEAPDWSTFGHIVIDEAQDLSPMQLRVIQRRALAPSMTIVGDLNQATGPWAPRAWSELTHHLSPGRPVTHANLTTNYRTPGEIMRYAARVLAVLGGSAPDSVREGEAEPRVVQVDTSELLAAVVDAAALDRAAEEIDGEIDGFGTVAVITAPSMTDPLLGALSAARLDVGDARIDGIDAPITVVPAALAKGLEFDRVVVVEPAAIVAEVPHGRRALYVALTRPTQRLTVVHAQPLPPELQAN